MPKQAQISYRNSTISYHVIGQGNRLVIAFHGYGESAAHFDYLHSFAKENQTTVFALDLPYHGKTNWKEGLNCTTKELAEIIQLVLLKETNQHNQIFELWGYSMGGRIALGFYQDYPQLIKKLVLIAPDGIYTNPWYWLATQTSWGNRIFRKTMQKPHWFLKILHTGYQLKLINKSIFKFASTYLDDIKVRSDLYLRWTCFRKIYPRKHTIMQLNQAYHTPILGIYGDFDRIIPFQRVKSFWKKLNGPKQVIHINDGHKLLQVKYAQYLWKD